MQQNQLDILMLAISGLKNEILGLDSRLGARIDALDSKLDTQFALLRNGIAEIKTELVAKINSQSKDFEHRLKRLEEPKL